MHAQPQPLTTGMIIRKTLALGLLGFLFVALSGPIFTVAGFAAIGYVIYRGFRFVAFGERPPEGKAVGTTVKSIFAKAFEIVKLPAVLLWRGVSGAGKLATGSVWLTWVVASEVLTSAILGAALGVLIGLPTGWDRVTVALGGGLGALMGLWNGVARAWPRRTPQPLVLPTCLRQNAGAC